MSEEEKKAIQYLNKYCDTDLFYEQQHYNYIKMVIKLVEKQQKELEQEKEKNEELEKHQKQYLDGELITAKQGKFFEKMIKENYIRKDKIKEIVDEHIPKQPNIITGEIEYTPNANANSFLVQDILKLLEEK